MKIKRLDAENFLSFKKLEYKFPKSGLVFIGGEKVDSVISSSNGAGKSAFTEALCWGLFGETVRKADKDAVVNRKVGKNCQVAVLFDDDAGDEYLVSRFRNDTAHGNELVLFKGNDEITSTSARDTQKEIDRILGMNWAVFSSAVIFGEKAQRFSQATDREKKEIFDDILVLHSYSRAQDEAKDELKRTKEIMVDDERALQVENGLKENFEIELEELEAKKKTVEELKLQIDSEVTQLRLNIDTYEKDKKEQEGLLRESESNCDELRGESKAIRAKVREFEDKKAAEMEEASSIYQEALLALRGIDVNISILEKQCRDIYDLETDASCPTCGQDVTEASIEKVVKKFEKKLKPLLAEKKDITEKTEKAMAERDVIKEKWDKKIDKLIVAEEELDDTIKEFEREIGLSKDELAGLESEIKDAQRDIEKLEQEAELAEGYVMKAINDKEKRLIEVEETIKSVQKELDKFSEDVPYLEFWIEAFGNKGIKSFLIDEVVPILNNRVSAYASALMDDSVVVEFDTQTKLKSGEYREKFDIKLIVGEEEIDYCSFSAGEKRKIDVAILLALQNLIFERSASSCNMVVFDEVFDSLDKVGIERVINLLQEEAKDKSIYVISHISELADYFDNTIIIKNKDGISELEA